MGGRLGCTSFAPSMYTGKESDDFESFKDAGCRPSSKAAFTRRQSSRKRRYPPHLRLFESSGFFVRHRASLLLKPTP